MSEQLKCSIWEEQVLKKFPSPIDDDVFVIPTSILTTFGPTTATFLTSLINKYRSLRESGAINEGDQFPYLYTELREKTALSDHQIRTCKLKLIQRGLLCTEKRSFPQREYYQINLKRLTMKYLMTE